jgi:hypothetical protein
MKSLKRYQVALRKRVFHRDDLFPADGIPYVLGQGLTSPYIEPGLTVHWHPPFAVMADEEPIRKENRISHLLGKLGLRRGSA